MALPTILVKPLQTRDTIYALQTGLLKVTIQTKKFWLNRDLIFSEKGSFVKPKETNIYFDISLSSGELVGWQIHAPKTQHFTWDHITEASQILNWDKRDFFAAVDLSPDYWENFKSNIKLRPKRDKISLLKPPRTKVTISYLQVLIWDQTLRKLKVGY